MLPPLRGFCGGRHNREAVEAYSPMRERGVDQFNTMNRECGDRNNNVSIPNLSLEAQTKPFI
jgi:hypothetical protein